MPDGTEQATPQRRIVTRTIEEEMKRSYIDYAMSVIVGRALPDVRDGLKPVQRRILHAMNELNMSAGSQHKKSARVVGECFVHGTLVSTSRGLVPIEKIRKGDTVFTETGQGRVTRLYGMPARPLLKVELDNGLSATSTESQAFRVVNPDLTFGWRAARELRPGDWVVLRSAFKSTGPETQSLRPFRDRQMRLTPGMAYMLGQLMSDGWVSHEKGTHRLGFYSCDRAVVRRLQEIIYKEFNYRPSIEVKLPKEARYRAGFFIRISRKEINDYLVDIFKLRGLNSSTKHMPEKILAAPRHIVLAFISGLIDGDGSISPNRRVIHYGSVSRRLIDSLQVALHHLGYHAKRYSAEQDATRSSFANGRIINPRQTFHYLEVTGDEAWGLGKELVLTEQQKRLRLERLGPTSRRMRQNADILPFGSAVVFSELSKSHIGSGWFLGADGYNFRQGIRHSGGTKIRYSSTIHSLPLHLSQVRDWGILGKLKRIGSPLATHLEFVADRGITFRRVRSVTRARDAKTYDLEIEGEHNFMANGMVVHNCLGKFHPHGDMAVYDALVRMAQDFSLRYLLVDGQGNFGSIDGDMPAAMRYTECRLSRIAEQMLEDIDKETVEFMDNFDGTLKEPIVLPAKFPNLLVNGSSGIAVGMATNIPPHNLSEIVDALTLLIDDPGVPLEELFDPETGPVRGPDFPTSGIIYGIEGVYKAYKEGRGLIRLRAKAHFEEAGRDRARIVITEIPYMVNKAALVESIAILVKEKKIEGVTDLRDESDKGGMRIVLELKRDAVQDVVLNQLYARTQMESTFGMINLALVHGEPKVLPLKDTLACYIEHREDVVKKRTSFDLNKAQSREHIVEGLITAVDHLDDVIKLIRRAKDVEEARSGLMNRFLLSEEQSKAILDLRLQKLTSLEVQSLRGEQSQLKKKIEELQAILASRERILGIIKQELQELKDRFGGARKTSIETDVEEMEIEDLIPEEDMVVTITNTGYIKRLSVNTYRQQRRGGKGLIGMETKEEDYVVSLFVASTHEYLLFFSSKGKCYWLKTWRIPTGGRHAKGRPIINLLPRLEKDEQIQATIPVREFDERRTIVFATEKGKIKRTKLNAFRRPMIRGIKAIKLASGDELISARLSEGNEEVILASSMGLANRFDVKQVRCMGRTAAGVRGMRLRAGDSVVSMALATDPGRELLTVLENGLGKRTTIVNYRKTARGSRGVKTTNIERAKSKVIAVKEVTVDDELLLSTVGGMVIRVPVKGIRQTGRAAKGVRIMKLEEGDRVTAVVRIVSVEEEEQAVSDTTPPEAPEPEQ